MIPLLTSLLIFIGILVLKSKGALPSGVSPRLALHYPRSGPSPVALIATSERTHILDRPLCNLWQRRDTLTDELDKQLLERLRALGDVDWRCGDTVSAELKAPRPQGLPLSVRVVSDAYDQTVAALVARGIAEPEVVAEAFLAAASGASLPTLVTTDKKLIGQLSDGPSASPDAPYRSGPDAGASTVELNGRRVRILVI